MESYVGIDENSKNFLERKKINIDSRTKLIILLLTNISIIFSTSIKYEIMLVSIIFIFGMVCGMYKFSTKMLISYLIIISVQILSNMYFPSAIKMMCITFIIFIRKLLPCGIVGGIIIGTTHADEFMMAMNKFRMPKSIVISLTIMLRYFPMIREDWNSIKNAMKMRGISPSIIGIIIHPVRTMECIYVPLIMSAAKVSDELSAAAVTRGIENPEPHTCIRNIKFHMIDYVWTFVFMVTFILSFTINWR
ncbi:energy-coupling factor transporter transmembrane component T [Clostridium weizhouense]|uniref:Energy-coupling factor transporter transmembrane protein EcfT n=1 Tax=Clostridium weizhouense TaxID=2859781 RepID=A0ABS7ANF7_9CLOT|nr:energy-coupling factor transporter transmembrane component T [Clostridium weizhouense]MBW6409618.1 energy-coupling factor transporter transmembrane protein EcfT [Clostridium weizhouense]